MLAFDRRTTTSLPSEGSQSAIAGPSRLRTQPQILQPKPVRPKKSSRREITPSDSGSDYAESQFEPSPPRVVLPPTPRSRDVPTPSRPPSRTERRFKCIHEGCDKAYFKPSRLKEHELTHTGERPHPCPHCDQTYLRASHLTAHMRTHLPSSARSFVCGNQGCDKAFWTATHLKRHMAMHEQAEVYSCPHCPSTFHKANQLRDHHALAHMPAGTKSYQCTHEGCSSSFAVRQQLKAHEKTHDTSRYTCSHPSHPSPPQFPTWSSLQSHVHSAHPPECPHPECAGRTFVNSQRLKDHLKVHAHRAEDMAKKADANMVAIEEGGDELDILKAGRKRRRSSTGEKATSSKLVRVAEGTAGKVWRCEESGCEKRFKTKFALKTHRRTAHIPVGTDNNKVHKCPMEGCDKSYAHACNLRDHISSTHSTTPIIIPTTPSSSSSGIIKPISQSKAALITGQISIEARRYGCPFSHLPPALDDTFLQRLPCYARFWRVYDVRRHLGADHGVELEDGEVRELLAGVKA